MGGACVPVCVYVYVCVHVCYVWMYVRARACVCACVYVYVSLLVCVGRGDVVRINIFNEMTCFTFNMCVCVLLFEFWIEFN